MSYSIMTYSVEIYFADLLNNCAISGGDPKSVVKMLTILYIVILP